MLSQLDIILILVEIRLHKIFRGANLTEPQTQDRCYHSNRHTESNKKSDSYKITHILTSLVF